MKIKEWFRKLVAGMAIGAGAAIPGVSGAAIAVIFRVYEDIIGAVNNFRQKFGWAIKVLIPILLGILVAVAVCIVLFSWAFEHVMFILICLFAGFLIVFGFGGYKLANVIKNFLDKYSSNIAGRIHESEQLKLKAVIAFDEINKRAEAINDEVVKMKTDVNKQMEQIQKGFQEKADKVADRIIKNNKERIEADKKELIEKTTKTIQECVIRYITEYNKQTPSEQKDKNIINMLLKVDFKKLLND